MYAPAHAACKVCVYAEWLKFILYIADRQGPWSRKYREAWHMSGNESSIEESVAAWSRDVSVKDKIMKF